MTLETEFNRRKTDTGIHTPFDISKLIAAEGDEKQRTFLLVLNNINNSLVENIRQTRALSDNIERHTEEFQSHLEKFNAHTQSQDEVINKHKGARTVILWLASAVQAIGIAIWVSVSADNSQIHKELETNLIYHAHNTERDDAQDRRILRLEEKAK